MAAAHTAHVTSEGTEKIVRLPKEVPLKIGPVFYEIRGTGEVILTSTELVRKPDTWAAFFDHLDSTPRDPDFMKERPMNRLPVERNFFPDE